MLPISASNFVFLFIIETYRVSDQFLTYMSTEYIASPTIDLTLIAPPTFKMLKDLEGLTQDMEDVLETIRKGEDMQNVDIDTKLHTEAKNLKDVMEHIKALAIIRAVNQ